MGHMSRIGELRRFLLIGLAVGFADGAAWVPSAHGVEAFTDIGASLQGTSLSAGAWGDYDNDGDLDILLTGASGSGSIAKVYRNDGGGTFTEVTTAGITGVNRGSVAWGDYDGDGDLDILLTGCTDPSLCSMDLAKVYRNDGDGKFTDVSAALEKVGAGSAAWGDYDNDGDLDILISGEDSDTGRITKVYRNDAGVFTDIHAALVEVYVSSVAWGDYDNDGDLDILLTGHNSVTGDTAKVYRNDGGGTFTDIGATLQGVFRSAVAWGDYDNDGDLDVLLAGMTNSAATSRVYRNDGGGTFTDISAALVAMDGASAAWGDYDNDGDLDILLAGQSSSGQTVKVYRNDGSGTFVDIGAGLMGGYWSSVAWGDYDNDGDLDILIVGSTGSADIAKVYRNNAGAANSVPSAPAGLMASVNGSQVAFSWTASSDTQTSAAGLTYNLRVGTAPGTVDIVPPMAHATTGYRRIPAMGNAQHGLTALLKSPPPGTYSWSVQAVDSAFAGSSFATEQSFVISAPTPTPTFTSTPTPTTTLTPTATSSPTPSVTLTAPGSSGGLILAIGLILVAVCWPLFCRSSSARGSSPSGKAGE
jgi:predicted nucleotidyltransferase